MPSIESRWRGLRELLVLALESGELVTHVLKRLQVHHDVYVCASDLTSTLKALDASTQYLIPACAHHKLII